MEISGDIICALSTPPGMGALAMVRVSGKGSIALVDAIFSGNLEAAPTHTVHHGWITWKGERLDDVVVSVFRGPKSFTGDDTVEISCHGSVFIQQRLLEVLVAGGARLAKAGEFSMRAYLAGKMDLSQAEAVADLIASESSAAHRQAVFQLRGGFSRELNGLREQLLHFASLVELELDFAEEDVEFADRSKLTGLIEQLLNHTERLRDSFALGNALRNGVPVAIAGAPNAGKSTLLNALLNEERAIVSDIAGTTRDTIEDQITIGGMRFRFIDTAGIRDTDNTIEKMGIERAMLKVSEAAIVMLLFDVNTSAESDVRAMKQAIAERTRSDAKVFLLANKCDPGKVSEAEVLQKFGAIGDVLAISARDHFHLDRLREQLMSEVASWSTSPGETIVTNARHHAALSAAVISLTDVRKGLSEGRTSDLLAIDIRKTIYHLGEITGQISSDDVLHNIFSKFCIGK
ncbi:MAG: tRNA uridine-5-carboxymethylaminomethyl(34) synthesis GTPase MnmE [Flavobacteriales bacterium]|nr:tRNA uridine-5-carboxymethylaminomethyl(34) synthesis GTPase MnmE [Flavobacteriales bacterium]